MKVEVFKRTVNFNDVPGEMIKYKNFAGRDVNGYNQNHERMFDVELDEPTAKLLYDFGWRVKVYGTDPDTGRRPKNPGFYDELDNKTYRVTVKVSYKYPITVQRVVEGVPKKRKLYPDVKDRDYNINILDNDNIVKADIQVKGSMSKNDGIISLYVDAATFIVSQCSAIDKYADLELDDYIPQEDFDGEAPWEEKE